MRDLDMQSWPRRQHFELYTALDHPHFGMCANVDVSLFRPAIKAMALSLTVAITYAIARTANEIPEFRYRIRGNGVVEYDLVHPSITILASEDLFAFCTLTYRGSFTEFAAQAAEAIELAKESPSLADPPGRDDLLYMTAIPWVSFTSFMHPMHLQPVDSVPRFAWGKLFDDGPLLKMPLAVQGHHALMDGIHVGRFYARIQDYFCSPQLLLGTG